MNTLKKLLKTMSNNKIVWSELSPDKKEEILKVVAKGYVDFWNQEHKKFMENLHYELFTPFYIKWWHQLKLKFK